MLRSGLGFSFFEGGCVLTPMFGTGTAVVDAIVGEVFEKRGRVAIVANSTESRAYGMRTVPDSYLCMQMFQRWCGTLSML